MAIEVISPRQTANAEACRRLLFFFSSRRRHTRSYGDWSSDVCSSDLVTVLPLHHPIRVAEQWATLDLLSDGRVDFAAGRGYDRREYAPFHVSFEDNQAIFEEGMDIVRRLWTSEAPISHHGKHYQFDNVAIPPRPVQRPIPAYIAAFSKPSIELAGRLGCNLIVAPFAAALTFGGLRQMAEVYRDSCARHGNQPGRLMCSYFLH